jgi:hypothetical protein
MLGGEQMRCNLEALTRLVGLIYIRCYPYQRRRP